jgi:putative FmdB family regulatory protein
MKTQAKCRLLVFIIPHSAFPPMPTYEYKCEACGHAFEKFQSIKAGPIRKCPNCGKMKVKKLISKGAGLIFKGSGFYITDYRSEGYKDQAKAEGGSNNSGGESKTESKEAPKTNTDAKPATEAAPTTSEAKSESKPAAKAEIKPASAPAKSSKSDKK